MIKLNKLTVAAAIASAAMMPMASHAVLIDGVTFNAGDQFVATTIWEQVLTLSTQSLEGVGRINSIDCTSFCGGTSWIAGQNDTQLTYYFSGYSVAKWYDQDNVSHLAGVEGGLDNGLGNAFSFATAKAIDFTGGNIKIFSDRVSTGTALNPTGTFNTATDILRAIDGNLWLEYDGATTTDLLFVATLGARVGTLFSAGTGGNNVHATGTGFGYLDAVGGLAYSNFNTDSFNVLGTITDAKLTSSFSTGNCGAWPLCGTADIKTTAIPEPGSLALVALGLVGLAASFRRKSVAKAQSESI